MSAIILDGGLFASQIKEEIAGEVEQLTSAGLRPGLAAVLVGSDPASQTYVRSKVRTCEQLGIYSELIAPPEAFRTSGDTTLRPMVPIPVGRSTMYPK